MAYAVLGITAFLALCTSGSNSARAGQPSPCEWYITGPGWYDISDRTAVRDTWNLVYVSANSVPSGWAGDVAKGDAGDTKPEYKDAVTMLVNWFRAMAGVPAVITLNTGYNIKAQQAAMMFSVNRQLTHYPPSSWVNFSATAAEAAARSNICLGWEPPGCVVSYIVESGATNASVGHRRWMLLPQTLTMG